MYLIWAGDTQKLKSVHLNDWRRGFNTQGNIYTHGRCTSKRQYTHNIYNRLGRYQENEGIVLKLVPNVSSMLSKEFSESKATE